MNIWWMVPLLWISAALVPDAPVAPHDAKTFHIVAKNFAFAVTPSPLVVDQGDVVTLVLSADDNGAGAGHSFLLDTYDEDGVDLQPGKPPVTIQFTAHTAGEFYFRCVTFCGHGHFGMNGVLTVNAVTQPPLSIADVQPSSGPTSGGSIVTITGSGFEPGARVAFGGLPAMSVNVLRDTELWAQTPQGPFDFASARTVDVVVTNPDGATAQKAFTWTVPPPSIVSVSPPRGGSAGGTLVTIRGAGFSTALPVTATFGGVAATDVTVVDAVTLRVRTPAHAPGATDVALTTSKGSATLARAFTFTPAKRRVVRR